MTRRSFAPHAPPRLVHALRRRAGGNLPPVYALDMVGFGHTEKPALSYTQHLWEAQVVVPPPTTTTTAHTHAHARTPTPLPSPLPLPSPHPS